jgi:hypothetical protein
MPVCLACTHGPALSMQTLCVIRTYGQTSRWFSSQTQSPIFKSLPGSILTLHPDTTAVYRTRNRTRIFGRSVSSSSSSVSSRTPQALTLLHKTRSFLPRALRHGESTNSLDFWNRILSEISEDLSAKEMAETKVGIVGECPNRQPYCKINACEWF